MDPALPYSIVSTSDRPDLVATTARWRWEAFFQARGRPFEDVLAEAQATAASPPPLPRTLVLLADGEPVGTASLVAHDLEERPELTPWLAGVVVLPNARGQGHATRLVVAVEAEAVAAAISTLWLYTRTAERLYARAGWRTTETIQHNGRPYALMRRTLAAG